MVQTKNIFRLDGKDLANEFYKKFEVWNRYTQANGLQTKMINAYNCYYGNYYSNKSSSGLQVTGEQGEFAATAVNHLRNILQYVYNMTVENEIVFDARAVNGDVKSRNATVVANSVLEYYFKQKDFERPCKDTLEKSLIFGTAYLLVTWEKNQTIYSTDPDTQEPVYVGGPQFTSLSPFDVILDPTKDDFRKQDWVVVRELVNRFDLIALYPHLEEAIMAVDKPSDLQNFLPYWQDDNDNIWKFTLYHRKTPNVPAGRWMQFLEGAIVLEDAALPYPCLPIFECKPHNRSGGAYGHTIAFDLMPLQETVNLLSSTIVSNQRAFGTQNVVMPKGSGIQPVQVPGALNILEVDTDENGQMKKPEVLQLCSTPSEVFKHLQDTVTAMEQISGVNSAARGAPPPSLTSGTSIALVTTAANAFNKSVEDAYRSMLSKSASFLIDILKRYLAREETIAIVGRNQTSFVDSFTGEDLSPVQTVMINVGNPLAKSLAGRTEIANNLLNQGSIDAMQYQTILQTGQLPALLDMNTMQYNFILEENEKLSRGMPVQMLAIDNHEMHIKNHMVLAFRTDIRENGEILADVLNHIQEHLDQMEDMSFMNPTTLSLALGAPLQLPQPQFQGVPGMAGPQGEATPQDPNAQGGDMGVPPPAEGGGPSQSAQAAMEEGGAESVAASAVQRAAKEQAQANQTAG